MSHPIDSSAIAIGVEAALWFVGLVLLWRLILRPGARAARMALSVNLPPWPPTLPDLLLFLALGVLGGLAFQVAAVEALKHSHTRLAPETQLVLINTAFQAGILGGLAFHARVVGPRPRSVEPSPVVALKSGAVAFLVALPLLGLVGIAWQWSLRVFGLPIEAQDVLDLFRNVQGVLPRALLVALAVVVAPVTEEFVFRAGLFRFLRTRAPRWVALTAPALLFGALHVNWRNLDGLAAFAPLTAFGVVLAVVYERTGRIGAAIAAHALFNLNTIVLLLSGVDL